MTRVGSQRHKKKEKSINDSFIFCSWLSKVYVLDYPCFSVIHATPSTSLSRVMMLYSLLICDKT
jgi:hypothetical protein